MAGHRESILDHWAERARVPRASLDRHGTEIHVRPSSELDSRVILLEFETSSVLSIPYVLASDLPEEAIRPREAKTTSDELVAGWLHGDLSLSTCDFFYYLEPHQPQPTVPPALRRLDAKDCDALENLQARSSRRDLERSQIAIDDPLVLGYFQDQQLMSVASLLYRGNRVADVGVLTSPEARGRGLARLVVDHLGWLGQARGKLVQYSSQHDNPMSSRVAEGLDYRLCVTVTAFGSQN